MQLNKRKSKSQQIHHGIAIKWLSLLLLTGIPSNTYSQTNNTSTYQSASLPSKTDKKRDAEQLGMALEYFTSGKYHESLLIFQKLAGHYRLNPRYTAYMGVCYYYEWEYAEAIKCFDAAIPKLDKFSPLERSFYYWADAESYFALQQYARAIPLYIKRLQFCHDNEKSDAHYRLGFCYLFLEDWANAWIYFREARVGYQQYRSVDEKSRIAQIDHMIKGLDEKVAKAILTHIGINKAKGK